MKYFSVEILHDQRNEVVRARTENGRELLLKRGLARTSAGDGALLNEGLTYQLLRDLGMADVAPRCILHDRENDVIVMEFIDATTVRENWQKFGDDKRTWADLGGFLARFHAKGSQAPEWTHRILGSFDELVPSAGPIQPRGLIEATHGQIQIIKSIQSDPLIYSRLASLSSPMPETLIHGDARMDNLLVDAGGELRLIDFELTRVGDPLFDLGTLIGSLIEHVAFESPPKDDVKASTFIEHVVGQTYDLTRSIIAGYRATARAHSANLLDPEEFLSRLSGFVGVYFLHRAGALAQQFYAETRMGRIFALIGCSFMLNPSHFLRPLDLDASYIWLRNNGSLNSA